jgi:hypothetical protein
MILSAVLRITAVATLAMVALSLQAQDGFERISTDTIEWNGHRFELARVHELKEPLGHGVKKLVNRKGEVVAVFNPCRPWEPNTSWYPSHLTIDGDTIVTLENQFAQLAKNDSTIIMHVGGRGSPPVQVYNPITGLKTIHVGPSLGGGRSAYNFDMADGIYSFGYGSKSQGLTKNPCLAGKHSFSGNLLWEVTLDRCPGFFESREYYRGDENLMLRGSLGNSGMYNGMYNDTTVYYVLDLESGTLKCSWMQSTPNPGLGEFKSFVGNDKFVCLLGKEWVVYSLKGKCRQVKRGKLLTDRFVHGGVGSFKSGRIIGWAHGGTSQIQFIDLRTNRTGTVSIDGMVFENYSRYIEENTILYKSASSDKPDLIIKLIE